MLRTYFIERFLPVCGTKGRKLLCSLEVTTFLAFVKERQSLNNVIILQISKYCSEVSISSLEKNSRENTLLLSPSKLFQGNHKAMIAIPKSLK